MHPRLNQHPVVKDFFWLTKYTSPHGTEAKRFGALMDSLGATQDDHGNFIVTIGEGSRTIFAAHLDTADSKMERVRRLVKGKIVSSDGKTILGADNRAGMAVLLHMIRNKVPGTYMFFVGEEVGRVGSDPAAEDLLDREVDDGCRSYDRIICWDRWGCTSIITHQMGTRSCSEEFAADLALQYKYADRSLKLSGDDGGSFTDSYSFLWSVPECTNISVGYMLQHSKQEFQDVDFLVRIAEASVKVMWEELPTVQDRYEREDIYSFGHFTGSRFDLDSYNVKVGGSKRKTTSLPGYPPVIQDELPRTVNYHGKEMRSDERIYAVDIDELMLTTMQGGLTRAHVEEFVYGYPGDTTQLLYDLLQATDDFPELFDHIVH